MESARKFVLWKDWAARHGGRIGHKFSEIHLILPNEANKNMTHMCWDMLSHKSRGQNQVDVFIVLITIAQPHEPSQSMYSFIAVD